MKKVLFGLTLLFTLSLSSSAQKQRFYYYPQANVYYDVKNKQYIYSNNGTWTTVSTLPADINVNRSPRVVVHSTTPEVWNQNSLHVERYRNIADNYPKGRATGYKGTNPNRAEGKLRNKPH